VALAIAVACCIPYKKRVGAVTASIVALILLALCMLKLAGGTFSPFIYFRF
jgi:hypothetical protein